MEITPKTNINALLQAYPELEAYLMQLNKKYKKLKNPVLRRTVGRIATLTQVAKIGGFEVLDLVNRLRSEVAQPPLGETAVETEAKEVEKRPEWAKAVPAVTLDGTALLDAEKNPLTEVSKAMKTLEPAEVLCLTTDFSPAPLIDTFREQGYAVWSEEYNENDYRTYILSR
ncbi:MAG: hypothetical protein B5M52_01560 [Helicobacteraceae bacterium 4484_230]|nr:MAG: hypothetical protein B5M52_01560 [Helicobacteraceae bacterium 4484_230]